MSEWVFGYFVGLVIGGVISWNATVTYFRGKR